MAPLHITWCTGETLRPQPSCVTTSPRHVSHQHHLLVSNETRLATASARPLFTRQQKFIIARRWTATHPFNGLGI